MLYLQGKTPYFALHKGIAIGFLKAIGFRNKPKRMIFAFWCGDPFKYLSPLGWEHINLTGDYQWKGNRLAQGRFRPLRIPNHP